MSAKVQNKKEKEGGTKEGRPSNATVSYREKLRMQNYRSFLFFVSQVRVQTGVYQRPFGSQRE